MKVRSHVCLHKTRRTYHLDKFLKKGQYVLAVSMHLSRVYTFCSRFALIILAVELVLPLMKLKALVPRETRDEERWPYKKCLMRVSRQVSQCRERRPGLSDLLASSLGRAQRPRSRLPLLHLHSSPLTQKWIMFELIQDKYIASWLGLGLMQVKSHVNLSGTTID